MGIRGNFTAEEGATYPDDLDTGYNVVLRKDVKVGQNVKIWSGTVIDPGTIIGDNVRIHCNCYISQGCIIEDDVFIGPGTVLFVSRKGSSSGAGVPSCRG
jgi:UDP-3-O-[3-hydroxymyristoyl] glucosamine N-acyltransferase